MPDVVYRTMTLICGLVGSVPIGTNLGLLQLLWMLVSGQLLATRGAVIPGLDACGLARRAVQRAWGALRQGHWTSERLLARWAAQVRQEGQWRPCLHEGYQPVPVDVTAFWRPRLRGCPTTHYSAEAGRALPAIPIGLVGRVGMVGHQHLALPLAFVPAPTEDPSPAAHARALVRVAVAVAQTDDVLVLDAGFPLALLHEAGARRYVVRLAQNAAFRRVTPPPYRGRGRPPTRGTLVRPLPRTRRGRLLPATPPDQETAWEETPGVWLRAAVWTDVVPSQGHTDPTTPRLTVVAVWDPRYHHPWLLASPLPLTPQALHALYHDRWPVEQLPLVAKQLLGAARQFVHAPQTCQRLPALALLAGAILAYVAATTPASPTGFWDRRPQPTAGRLRRLLAHQPFPQDFPLPTRLRIKRAPTAHLHTGFWGQHRPRDPSSTDAA